MKKTIIETVKVGTEQAGGQRQKLRVVLSKSAGFKALMEKSTNLKKENETAFTKLYGEKKI